MIWRVPGGCPGQGAVSAVRERAGRPFPGRWRGSDLQGYGLNRAEALQSHLLKHLRMTGNTVGFPELLRPPRTRQAELSEERSRFSLSAEALFQMPVQFLALKVEVCHTLGGSRASRYPVVELADQKPYCTASGCPAPPWELDGVDKW